MGLRARLAALADKNDVVYSFVTTPAAWFSAAVLVVLVAAALLAPWLSSVNPFDLGSLDVTDAHLPPAWTEEGDARFWLGTDDQGRDLWSAILYGLRLSLSISLVSVALSIVIGVGLGVTAGFAGGWIDTVLMRVCDVMLSFPAILVALLADGILRSAFPGAAHESVAYFVLIFAITLSGWVPYARTVRGLTLVEKGKEFVMAAELIGEKKLTVMRRHLIRIGNDYLFSGEWWICIFPGIVLIAVVLAVNLLGDWLRDAVNPGLQ